jgi:formylmethanofuran dehydrogenase subunit A
MLTLLRGGRVIDPANGTDETRELWFQDGRIVQPAPGQQPAQTYDASGLMVLAGGIDIHSHIASAAVTAARLLLPELRENGDFEPTPISTRIGRLYAAMGFTLVVEPAVLPHQAVQAHAELSAIPLIDKAMLVVLGNEDYLLRLLRAGESQAAIADYAARTLAGSRAIGLKCINPGGSAAFKENARAFGLDDEVPSYGVSSRRIMQALQHTVHNLGIPHPLHLHCNNLGLPGNVETALATIAASDGLPLHLAHLQFYAYGKEGKRGFSSAASQLAEAVNTAPNMTADVGQVMFGQTVTISCDTLRQFGGRYAAHPHKWAINDSEGNGFGIVPYRYRRTSGINAIQWAAGLELFLLIQDPWRVFFTTDHPNGAPFTAYPDLFALLMSRDLRAQWIQELPAAAMALTTLPSITREYNWTEIATMTRAAPARLLGLTDRGHLAPGARADIAAYRPRPDRAETFRNAALVFKDGELVIRDGQPLTQKHGRTLAVFPPAADDTKIAAYYHDTYGVSRNVFDVPDWLAPFEPVPCR